MNPTELLSIITDMDGVVGCFLGDSQGTLTAHRMPESYGISDLVLALDQAVLLLQPAGGEGLTSDQGIIYCGDHSMAVQKLRFGYCCVLAVASVDTDQLNAKVGRLIDDVKPDHRDAKTLKPPSLSLYGEEDPATIPLFS